MFNEFRVIIAGSRDFEDYRLLKDCCDYYLKNKLLDPSIDVIIVSGNDRGAEILGEKYATERGLKVEKYPANWDKYGKKAGYLRNTKMIEVSNALIAFRSAYAENKSTDYMINAARRSHLLVREVTEEE